MPATENAQLHRQLAMARAGEGVLLAEGGGLRKGNNGPLDANRVAREEVSGLREDNSGLREEVGGLREENGGLQAKVGQPGEENARLRAAVPSSFL